IVGGTTSGYSLMGSRHTAIAPTMKITIESTPAKMGRRMKKWEKFMISLMFGDLEAVVARHFLLRGYWHAGADALQPVDDNLFAPFQSRADYALALDRWTEFDRLVSDSVSGGDCEHVLLRLIGADSAL